MKKLKPSDFLIELENSNKYNLFIVPSVDSKRLFMKKLKYDKIKTDFITFGEIYIQYVRKNFLNLADEPIKKYYFTLSLSDGDDISRSDNLYNIIQQKVSLDLNLNSKEYEIYTNYRNTLKENGFIEKTDVIDMIIKEDYISTLKKYDNIFFILPRYTSLKEDEIVDKIINLDNTIVMEYSDNLLSTGKFKHYVSDGIDYLIYEIASQIIGNYKNNNNIKIAITTESKKLQNEIVRQLSEYNIYTNLPVNSIFYNINIVRESLNEDININNIDVYFEELKSNLTDEIIVNFRLESAFKRIIENIKKYNIEYPKLYIEDIFKTLKHSQRYESNIHVLNPAEIVLDYDIIYQIGISDSDFMPSDEFSTDDIIGAISNIISHCDDFILSTYDTNKITKSEFMMMDLENIYVRNFEWIKSGSQITSLQKKYFNEYYVNLDRKNNKVSHLNNYVSIPLRSILSASKIESYQKCPFKYYCDYIIEFKLDENEMYLELGNFVHKTLEMYFKDKRGKYYDESRFNSSMMVALAYIKTLKKFHVDMLENKLKNVIQKECFTPGIVYDTEEIFEHRFFNDENGNKIIFRGKIDRVDRTEDGEILIDYKLSTSSIPSKNKIKNGEALQLPIYVGYHYENVKELHYVDINSGERKSSIIFDDKFTKEDFMKLCAENIKQIVSKMDSGVIETTDDKNNCRNCQYLDFCKRFWND